LTADADFFFSFGQFQLGDAGFFDQVYQFFQFAQIHGLPQFNLADG
jgi:hypothetical protein